MDIILEKGKFIYCVNGFKFGRSPEKNNWKTRDINNRYSYHPVDITKEPLNQYQDIVIQSFQRRYKEYILMKPS